jgi:methylglutaconyl-CoA hydratase
MTETKVLYQIHEGIARITLNRPEKRNALDRELISQLKQAISASAGDPACRVVLMAGAGKDFSSGADLAGLEKTAHADILDNMNDARQMAELFLAMRNHPRPIIAAVHGRALAGGCGLATACDIILAAESAQIRSISEKAAFELVAGGEIISATRAHDLGLVHRVFADDQFAGQINAYATKLAAKSASAVMLTKKLLYHIDSMSFAAALEAGVEINAIARMTEDCRQGVEKFLKKA